MVIVYSSNSHLPDQYELRKSKNKNSIHVGYFGIIKLVLPNTSYVKNVGFQLFYVTQRGYLLELCNERSTTKTTGGANNPNGLDCCNKFVYTNQERTGCISTPNVGGRDARPWCGIYNNYDTTLAWGYCVNPSGGTK